VLRAVFEFDGLRRASGSSGMLKRYNVAEGNTLRYEYLGADSLPTPWPNSMLVQINTSEVDARDVVGTADD
jgi:linoleate 10R-lipoxygenase